MTRDHLVNWKQDLSPLPEKKVVVEKKTESSSLAKFDKKTAYAKGTDDFCTKYHMPSDDVIHRSCKQTQKEILTWTLKTLEGSSVVHAGAIASSSLTAGKIDTRLLTINDSQGNVAFQADSNGPLMTWPASGGSIKLQTGDSGKVLKISENSGPSWASVAPPAFTGRIVNTSETLKTHAVPAAKFKEGDQIIVSNIKDELWGTSGFVIYVDEAENEILCGLYIYKSDTGSYEYDEYYCTPDELAIVKPAEEVKEAGLSWPMPAAANHCGEISLTGISGVSSLGTTTYLNSYLCDEIKLPEFKGDFLKKSGYLKVGDQVTVKNLGPFYDGAYGKVLEVTEDPYSTGLTYVCQVGSMVLCLKDHQLTTVN